MTEEKSQINEETQSPHEQARAKEDWNVRSHPTCDRSDGAQMDEERTPQKTWVLAGCGEKEEGTEPFKNPEKLPGKIQISEELWKAMIACQEEVERLLQIQQAAKRGGSQSPNMEVTWIWGLATSIDWSHQEGHRGPEN